MDRAFNISSPVLARTANRLFADVSAKMLLAIHDTKGDA